MFVVRHLRNKVLWMSLYTKWFNGTNLRFLVSLQYVLQYLFLRMDGFWRLLHKILLQMRGKNAKKPHKYRVHHLKALKK